MSTPRTTPQETSGLPPGIPYIIGNELAERFSFYGMKAILTVYMTQHLLNSAGEPDYLNDEEAKSYFHLFTAAAYLFPILGALLSDIFLGKYTTILTLSLGYCVGHAFLAMGDTGAGVMLMEPRSWLWLGLLFIAIGAGGIKPCVSAHVGDQFGPKNKHLISRVFSWFYFAINLGAAASTFLTPVLLAEYGPWAAFGLPGVLMAIATFVFWFGRNSFVHIPPGGFEFVRETFSEDGRRALLNLAPLFLLFIPMFWAIFDQTGSAWVLQAEGMNRQLGILWLKSQIQVVNPVLILILIPTFAYGLYPAVSRVWQLTPLRKIGIGLFVTAAAFAISAWIDTQIAAGAPEVIGQLASALPDAITADMSLSDAVQAARDADWDDARIQGYLVNQPSIGWQFLAYMVLTAAEVMVSITALEFAYTQAPKQMKSFIMGVYYLGVSIGNLFTAGVNWFIRGDDGSTMLAGADYYWFFTGLMVIVAILYVPFAMFYKGQTFVQGEDAGDAQTEGQAG